MSPGGPSGGIDWAHIPPEIETATKGLVKAGPIRVMAGVHFGPNRGYGRAHIISEHPTDFAVCGFDSFVNEAIKNFAQILQQKDKVIMLFRSGKSRTLAVLEYRQEGNATAYYSVITAFRMAPTRKLTGASLWERE